MIITIPMILGIIFSYYLKINSSFLFIAILISFLIFLFSIIFEFFKKRYLVILFFFIGILITYMKLESSTLIKFLNKDIELEGTIRETIYNEKDISKYILNVEKIVDNGASYFLNENLSLKVIGQDKFEIGDKVLLSGVLKKPNKNTNPKLFNYRLYLQTRGIYTTIIVKKT